jgi:hypothetical protein
MPYQRILHRTQFIKLFISLVSFRRFSALFLLILTLSLSLAPMALAKDSEDTFVTNYEPSQENFLNPERGFFRVFGGLWKGKYYPMTPEKLRTMRNNYGITLVRASYVIEEFRNKPLSDKFLTQLKSDFAAARKAGIKLMPHFLYNLDEGGEDAPVNIILKHLEQLKPIFKENTDVTAFLEGSFVGYWGEWHSSKHKLVNPVMGKEINDKTKTIANAILNSFPQERMIVLRTPRYKQQLFGDAPLSSKEAFNRTPRARVGSTNLCLLSSPDDLGTYINVEKDKKWMNLDNLFVPMSGETCSAKEKAQPFIGCKNALKELKQLRYSALNSEHEGDVIKLWESQGCMQEIEKHLGYRFRLVSSKIPKKVTAGENFSMSFDIQNDGWASPYNPRNVQIILRNRRTGKQHGMRLQQDPRFWMPGERRTINLSNLIPRNLTPGSYEVLLNLPDPQPRLSDRPEYSIRFANKDVWQPNTGYNSFLRNVEVTQ